MTKTYFQSKEDADGSRNWLIVDASGVPLGRLASEVASLLRGKHKASFTPHNDGGDFVIVLNADKVVLTGRKQDTKTYYHHSGYVSGLKAIPFRVMQKRKPERVIELAVKRMLPKGPLGYRTFRKLKVYVGEEHPHAAQKPQPWELRCTRAVKSQEKVSQEKAA